MSQKATSTPAPASVNVTAAPMPVAPPIMAATFPLRLARCSIRLICVLPQQVQSAMIQHGGTEARRAGRVNRLTLKSRLVDQKNKVTVGERAPIGEPRRL